MFKIDDRVDDRYVERVRGPALSGGNKMKFRVTRKVPQYEPEWHWRMYKQVSYVFPTADAAEMFSKSWQNQWPTATITITEVE